MRTVHQTLEVAAPAVLRVQAFPIRADGRQYGLVPDYFSVFEKVKISSAPLEVDGVHGLRPTCFEVDGLLLGGTRQFAASYHETLVSGVLHQLAEVQQECGLFLAKTHFALLISASFSTVRPPK